MCLLVLAWQAHPRYRLIVAANRDEYHDRQAEALGCWPPPEQMLAGRDLRAGGTWLAVDRRRRFGVITNYRDLQAAAPSAPTRGGLIPRFMRRDAAPGAFMADLETAAVGYGGFNLLLADDQSLWYACNRLTPFARALSPGVYGLSNERLDAPWPKLRRVRAGFETWLRRSITAATAGPAGASEAPDAHTENSAGLFALLADPRPATEAEGLPRSGLQSQWERTLSAPFVRHPQYGTRCSTVLLLEPCGALTILERRFDREARRIGESEYRLSAGEWPG